MSAGMLSLRRRTRGARGGRLPEDQSDASPYTASALERAAFNANNYAQNNTYEATFLPTLTRGLARTMTKEEERAKDDRASMRDLPAHGPGQSHGPEKWEPSFALGTPLWLAGEDLTRIEIADRKVAQRRKWNDHYGGSGDFPALLEEAIREREQLDETSKENTLPRSKLPSTRDSAIARRLGALRTALAKSVFPPERANIEAAIRGYETGAIPFSSSFTLLWAGRIVDTCPSYESFAAADRAERLDEYADQYGDGWLWYEPPLADDVGPGGGGPAAVAKKGFCLEAKPSWRKQTDNMGHYRLNMGFRRRKALVSRMGISVANGGRSSIIRVFARPLVGLDKAGKKREGERLAAAANTAAAATAVPRTGQRTGRITATIRTETEEDQDGPRVVWAMMLDCGATYPMLMPSDARRLGIDRESYAAQTVKEIINADNSVSFLMTFELDVSICADEQGDRGLVFSGTRNNNNSAKAVGAADPVWPSEPSFLGATIPVLFAAEDPPEDPAMPPDRLSGILPFHLCYFSGAPGTYRMWMGEDRRDVLGAGRLPGQMRYSHWKPDLKGPLEAGHPSWLVPRNHDDNDVRMSREEAQQRAMRLLRTPTRVAFDHDLEVHGADGGLPRVAGYLYDEDHAGGGSSIVVRTLPGTDIDQLLPSEPRSAARRHADDRVAKEKGGDHDYEEMRNECGEEDGQRTLPVAGSHRRRSFVRFGASTTHGEPQPPSAGVGKALKRKLTHRLQLSESVRRYHIEPRRRQSQQIALGRLRARRPDNESAAAVAAAAVAVQGNRAAGGAGGKRKGSVVESAEEPRSSKRQRNAAAETAMMPPAPPKKHGARLGPIKEGGEGVVSRQAKRRRMSQGHY